MRGFLGRHVHEWQITGTKCMTSGYGRRFTETLRRCMECGKTVVNEVDGHWTF